MKSDSHDGPAREIESDHITFYVGDLLLGIDIAVVDEINRHHDVTRVPHAPPFVLGVLNLRGDVVTILDLAMVLRVPCVKTSRESRIVIVRSDEERIGLSVGRVADVVTVCPDRLDQVPCNMKSPRANLFRGVHQLRNDIIAVLDVDAVLEAECCDSTMS